MNSIDNNKIRLSIDELRKIFDDFKNNIWTDRFNQKIHIKDMNNEYIKTCISFIKKYGDNSVYGLGHLWLPILEKELLKREENERRM